MMRNKVYAIVEGHGEANKPAPGAAPAVVVLMSKLLATLGCETLFPAGRVPPFRMRSYGEFFRGDKLENAIRLHKTYTDCAAILVLLDMDDDCARDKALELAGRIRAMEPLPFSVVVVCAKCEYESWFLASLETIQPGRAYQQDPELRRDAKGWLKKEFGYRPTRDQARLTRDLDVDLALERSRSFRRLHHAFVEIVAAARAGQPVITPAK
jgi:hypothetical protein